MKPQCASPLKGKAYKGSDGAVTCGLCDYEMDWEDCSACGGDGFFDGYEDDPNWYQPGELVDCHQCGAQGGEYWCGNDKCATMIALEILAEKPAEAP